MAEEEGEKFPPLLGCYIIQICREENAGVNFKGMKKSKSGKHPLLRFSLPSVSYFPSVLCYRSPRLHHFRVFSNLIVNWE